MAHRRLRKRYRQWLLAAARHAVLSAWLAVVLLPLFWMVSTSVKPPSDWFGWPPVWWPSHPTLANWRRVWIDGAVTGATARGTHIIGPLEATLHSLIIAVSASLLALLAGTLMAYGASRYRMLSDGQLLATLALRMVPPFVIGGPLVIWYSLIGLADTHIGLILLYALITLPYAILIMKSFVDDVPLELEQAAEMLGATRRQVIIEVVLPLLKPALWVTFLFLFVLDWSEFFLGLVLSRTHVTTLAVHLNRFAGGGGGFGYVAALSLGTTLPLIVIGLAIRRHLGRGLSFGMVGRYRR